MMFPSKHSLNIPIADSIDIVNQNHILINVSSYFLNTLSIFYKHISNFDIIWFNFKKQLIQASIMKKITLSLIAFSFISNAFAQILDQSANWPNSDWVLTGTYNEQTGLVSNPTEEGFTFLWDDDAAGNGSNSDDLQLTSPVIDLTSAAEGGENFIYIFGEYIYRVY